MLNLKIIFKLRFTNITIILKINLYKNIYELIVFDWREMEGRKTSIFYILCIYL